MDLTFIVDMHACMELAQGKRYVVFESNNILGKILEYWHIARARHLYIKIVENHISLSNVSSLHKPICS